MIGVSYLISQMFAAGSLIVTCMSTWGKKSNMLSMLVADSVCLTFCYGLLGEVSGAVISVCCLVRSLLALYYEKNPHKYKKVIPYVMMAAFVTIGFFTYTGASTIVATFAGVFSCFTVFSKRERIVRFSILIVIGLWLVYDIYVGSYVSMLGELISFLAAFAGVLVNEVPKLSQHKRLHLKLN